MNDKSGNLPLLLAAHKGHAAIVDALLKAGADPNTVDPQDGTFPLLMAGRMAMRRLWTRCCRRAQMRGIYIPS
jgi:hypothetical protein